VLLAGGLEQVLEAAEEEVKKLLGVLLESSVGGVALKIFVGEAKPERMKGLSL
jgi:hypothetical protein